MDPAPLTCKSCPAPVERKTVGKRAPTYCVKCIRARNHECVKRWSASPAGKEWLKRHAKSNAAKTATKRYRASPGGVAAERARSHKGKALKSYVNYMCSLDDGDRVLRNEE